MLDGISASGGSTYVQAGVGDEPGSSVRFVQPLLTHPSACRDFEAKPHAWTPPGAPGTPGAEPRSHAPAPCGWAAN